MKNKEVTIAIRSSSFARLEPSRELCFLAVHALEISSKATRVSALKWAHKALRSIPKKAWILIAWWTVVPRQALERLRLTLDTDVRGGTATDALPMAVYPNHKWYHCFSLTAYYQWKRMVQFVVGHTAMANVKAAASVAVRIVPLFFFLTAYYGRKRLAVRPVVSQDPAGVANIGENWLRRVYARTNFFFGLAGETPAPHQDRCCSGHLNRLIFLAPRAQFWLWRLSSRHHKVATTHKKEGIISAGAIRLIVGRPIAATVTAKGKVVPL